MVLPMENMVEATPEHVRAVYQECWSEFYEWEPNYCREELRKLRNGAVDLSCESVWDDIEEWDDDQGITGANTTDTIQLLHIGQQLAPSEVRVKTVKHEIDFAPVPPYEFCMPTSRCIPRIDEEEELEEEGPDCGLARRRRVLWIKFCPFTDPDEAFSTSQRDHLLGGTKLEWEIQPYVDNDVDVIEMETVSRLRELSFDDIDELHLLPRPIHSMGSELGILGRWHSRDTVTPPHWTTLNDLPASMQEKVSGELNRSFCPICVEFECIQHIRSQQLVEVSMPPPQTMVEVDRQCSDDCIFNHQDEEFSPSQDSVGLLHDLWFNYNALEWTRSCEIAKILAQPCWQVHHVMLQFLEGQGEEPTDRTGTRGKEKLSRSFEAPDFDNYMPYDPCAHVGPCIDCSCAVAQSWCGGACRCSKRCTRRARGCLCRDACVPERCPCKWENRECEPGICGKCWFTEGATKCTNNFVQRRESRKTEVRRAHFGWGLFALENISENDPIITYTGEIYTIDSAEARSIVAKHLKRNYIFGCGKKIDIDAYASGNESRVINESPKNDNNCLVESVWVAGDVHLVVVAQRSIKVGEELFLNYGKSFWTPGESHQLLAEPKRSAGSQRLGKVRLTSKPPS